MSTINVNQDYDDDVVKLIIIGDSGVGKSSLLIRLSDNIHTTNHSPTVGIDFRVYDLEIDGIVYKLQIWDTAGQERYRSIVESYYRGAMGILLVYDVTNEDSFANIDEWYTSVKYKSIADMLLVGNKCDVLNREVSTSAGWSKANSLEMDFIEVSAKEGTGINDMMTLIVFLIKKTQSFKQTYVDDLYKYDVSKDLDEKTLKCCF